MERLIYRVVQGVWPIYRCLSFRLQGLESDQVIHGEKLSRDLEQRFWYVVFVSVTLKAIFVIVTVNALAVSL